MLVLGLGNILMMDDGIGVYVVEELKKRNENTNIDYLIGETDIGYCIDIIRDYNYIVLIDAIYTNKNPGDVSVFNLNTLKYNCDFKYSLHNLHLLEVIDYYNKNLEGKFIGVELCEINYNYGLSKVLENKLPFIINEIENILNKLSQSLLL